MKNAEAVISDHIGSFRNNDLEAVMSDYTNESVLVTRDAIYKGLTEIKKFFSELIPHFPKRSTNFELDKITVNEELVLIVWNAATPTVDVPLGTDTFIIKDGKISQQTFIGQINLRN